MTTHDSQNELAGSPPPLPIPNRSSAPPAWKVDPSVPMPGPASQPLPVTQPGQVSKPLVSVPPQPSAGSPPQRPATVAPTRQTNTSTPPTPQQTPATKRLNPTTSGESADDDPDDEDPEDDAHDGAAPSQELREVASAAVVASPPWLVSLVIHMGVLLILSLLFVPLPFKDQIKLNLFFSDHVGEQLIDDDLDFGIEMPDAADDLTLTPDDLPPVDEPFAAPSPLTVQAEAPLATGELVTPNIGIALTGREKGMRNALLQVYGGNRATENAVTEALKWLQRNQRQDGSWSLSGPYTSGAPDENYPAATSMALLAFQGAGNTHQVGTYQKEVAKAWRYLLKHQDADGSWDTPVTNHRLYTHAQVTIAICELYGMTHDEEFRDPALKALDFAILAQSPAGGWRYYPKQDADLSVTGWFVMAFQSAMMAGLRAPSSTLEKVNEFLDSVSNDAGDRYSYLPHRPATPAMTAEALLCRQYLGWQRDDPRLQSGAQHLLANPIEYRQQNVYYWYYATQVLHHLEGPAWEQWNSILRDKIPSQQVTSGPERGSWEPDRDEWGALQGGRLFTTCLSTYMLEVYYRHLPIYGFKLH